MRPLYLKLCRLIYPLPDVPLNREVPLEVLALGISRAGTESLRNALVELGYDDVHHGIRFVLSDRERLQWLRLAWAQHTHDAAGLTTAKFDGVLGDCQAVTDMPACGFAHELLTAYPDAKVVLNYRPDVDAWYQSMLELETLGRTQTRKAYVLSWFQSDLFWQQRVATYWLRGRHVKGDFRKNGKAWYWEHYRSLEERLTREGRPFLKWKVEDGWKPLCKFLGKPPLSPPFASSTLPKEFHAQMSRIIVARRKQAEKNLQMFLRVAIPVLVVLVAILLSWLLYR